MVKRGWTDTIFAYFCILLFQPNDKNKRKVLADVLYLVRFPTMELDDFCKTVGNSGIWTAEEALDVLLHMKESTPCNKLVFSDKLRFGT